MFHTENNNWTIVTMTEASKNGLRQTTGQNSVVVIYET